jgi:hypothetical protein
VTEARQGQSIASFLKKRSKSLSVSWGSAVDASAASEIFLALFVKKELPSYFL